MFERACAEEPLSRSQAAFLGQQESFTGLRRGCFWAAVGTQGACHVRMWCSVAVSVTTGRGWADPVPHAGIRPSSAKCIQNIGKWKIIGAIMPSCALIVYNHCLGRHLSSALAMCDHGTIEARTARGHGLYVRRLSAAESQLAAGGDVQCGPRIAGADYRSRAASSYQVCI